MTSKMDSFRKRVTKSFILWLQFITFGFACTPLYFVWEKFIRVHETKSVFKRALARLPVVIPIWFLAIIFPFFGPINSTVGSLLVSFTVYIIPALAHMITFSTASAREVSLAILILLSKATNIRISAKKFIVSSLFMLIFFFFCFFGNRMQ